MNSLTVKILAALVSILMITTIATQAYYFLHDKHETEEAVLATVNEDIVFDGIVIRDETVMTYNGGGVLDYKYTDGSKVSVNSTVAEVFNNENDIAVRNRIQRIDQQIEQLEKAQNPGTAAYAEPEALLAGIDTEYTEMLGCLYDKDFEGLDKAKDQLNYSNGLYGIITGTVTDYDKAIGELKAKKSTLQSSAGGAVGSIKAEKTGYFVSYADGYEDVLTVGMADKLTEQDILNVVQGKAKPPANAVGKMFDSYNCKIAGIVKSDPRIVQDSEVSLMLNSSKNVYMCTVDRVTDLGDDRMLVILDCDRLDEALVESRTLSAKLVFDKYQGIKVPRSALRFRNGEKGVYVLLGKDISFKKVNVIYEGSDYILSENTSDEDYLLLYDQILLEVVSNKDVSDSSTGSAEGTQGADAAGSSELSEVSLSAAESQ